MRWQRKAAGIGAAGACLALLACLVTVGVLLQGSDGYGRRLRLVVESSTAGVEGERVSLSQVDYGLRFRHANDLLPIDDPTALTQRAFASTVAEGTVLSENLLAEPDHRLLAVTLISDESPQLRPGARILLARNGVTIPPQEAFLQVRSACGLRVVAVEPSGQANAGVGAIVWLELTDEQAHYQPLLDARPWVPVVLARGDCTIKEPTPTPMPTVAPTSTSGPSPTPPAAGKRKSRRLRSHCRSAAVAIRQ